MKISNVAALGVGLSLAVGGAAFGADPGNTGMMNGVTHGASGAKARCSPGDPNVLLDESTKTFTMDASMMNGKGGASSATTSSGSAMSGSAMAGSPASGSTASGATGGAKAATSGAAAAGPDTSTVGAAVGASTQGTSGGSTGNGATTGTANASVNGTAPPVRSLPGEVTVGPIPTPAATGAAASASGTAGTSSRASGASSRSSGASSGTTTASSGVIGSPGAPRIVSMCRSEALSMGATMSGAKAGRSGSMSMPSGSSGSMSTGGSMSPAASPTSTAGSATKP